MSTESTAKKPLYKKWWFWAVLLIALAAIGKGGSGGGTSSGGGASAASIVLPPMEARLIEIASTAQFESRKADNDMQRGGIKSKRDKALCESITSLAVMDWIGTIKKIDSNSDGKGVLEIEIAPDILIKTWNNAFSDMGDHTLLEPGSPVFETAAAMKRGRKVIVSGTLLKGSEGECIKEGSISLHGKISEPEFVFRFSAISAYDLAKQTAAPPVVVQPVAPAPQPAQVLAPPTNISALVGKDPESALDDPALKETFKMLLGDKLGEFRERLNVSSGITQEGEWLVGAGGMQHLFSIEEAAFAINSKTSKIFAIMLTEGKDIRWFGTSDVTNLPASLQNWYKAHGGT